MAGSYTFTVTATDSLGSTDSKTYTVAITSPFSISPSTLPGDTVNVPYSQTLTASGGTGTVTFTTTSGTLPTGVTLSTGGVLSGTPTATGSFSFTVTATDSANHMANQAYTMVINPTMTLSPGRSTSAPTP